ncbi:MAG: flavin reductase family protein [Emcibacter sp.]|nr:flavin reductase family protein [Emcibacter sp.]
MTKQGFDQKGFRDTLGQFATGVTIITTLDKNGDPVGITASSFNSVSMDPPLVLWSLAKNAFSLSCFQNAEYFNIHILSADQEDISNHFARAGTDKFHDMDFRSGRGNTPVLNNYAALLECRTRHQYDGGDHIIFVGEVLSHHHNAKKPLVFHQGQYASTQPMTAC